MEEFFSGCLELFLDLLFSFRVFSRFYLSPFSSFGVFEYIVRE